MRHVSKKTAARIAECKELRKQMVREIGRCELCWHDPKKVRPGNVAWALHVHEIARGATRQAALDKRYATLVLCYHCHMNRIHGNERWPETRQLAVLKTRRPKDYDLAAYNELVGYGPDRITDEDVCKWIKQRGES